jgi:hypothetical protein
MTRRIALTLLLPLAACQVVQAQTILVDRGVRAAGLWCFPLITNPQEYVYLPAQAALGKDDQGQPQFAFIRYAMEKPGTAEGGSTITASSGGGIVTLLVGYETPPETVEAAQKALRELVKDDKIVVRGPLVFKEGTYALVSSVLNPADATPERKLLASGRAPVLEGNRIALSFDLKPEQASLLMQSFAMNTPDISIVFDMTFAGLTEAYDAEMTIDWAEVRKSEGFSAGGSVYFVSADVEVMCDELLRNHAIKLRSSGSDSAMEGLLNTVYSKLLDLLFRPVEPEKVPEDKRGGLMDAINALVAAKAGPLSSRKLTGFGLYAGYQLKEMRSSGLSVLNFNHRSLVDRHSFITFNIGDFHRRFGNDPRYFRALNLADPVYQQREIHVGVDGALVPDFDRYINTVTVTLRKVHANGQETLKEVLLDRRTVTENPAGFTMIYGWNGDDDRQAWLRYDYRTRWSFKAGGSYETDWTASDAPMIDVFAPYERRTVQLLGSGDKLKEHGVRAAVVQIEYPFFGQVRKHQLIAKPDQTVEEQKVEIILPQNEFQYNYTVTWHLDGGGQRVARGHDSSGLVFVDEIPPQ